MSVVSGIVGAIAGQKGAKAQASAANRASDVSERMFEQTREDYAPFRQGGLNALSALQYELGVGSNPGTITRGPDGYMAGGKAFKSISQGRNYLRGQGLSDYKGFTGTPGYQFQLDEGAQAVDRSAAARGGLFSGATMKASQRFGQGVAAQEYGNYLARLGGLAGAGSSATAGTAAAGASSASQQGNALMQAGNARASGYQAIGQGVQTGIQGIGQIAGFFR